MTGARRYSFRLSLSIYYELRTSEIIVEYGKLLFFVALARFGLFRQNVE